MADEPDPVAVTEATAAFREAFDNSDEILDAVLTVDATHETWAFDDVALESGPFGELVSRGIVTRVDGGYRVASRRGVEAALEGTTVPVDDRPDSTDGLSDRFTIDQRGAAGLLGALLLLFVTRTLNYRSVFRGDHVVSPANDPYYYRYRLEELLADSNGATDTSIVTALSDGAIDRRPLTHTTNWFVAELLGGDQWAAEVVAAWLPVVGTLALGLVVYGLAVLVTDDVRVGIASVVILALTPVHAAYTGVGFLEHRVHQYFWLGVTLLALAWLAVDLQRRSRTSPTEATVREHLHQPWTWVSALVLGIALGLSMHTWGGSVLLLVPVAAYAGLKIAIDVRAGISPVWANTPLLVGLGVASAIVALLHVQWGWHETFTAVVPPLVVVGTVAVAGIGALWQRFEWPSWGFLGLEGIVAVVGMTAFRLSRPDDWARLYERADDLVLREGATETTSLFALENAVIFGPLSQFGLHFFLGILVLVWAVWISYRRYAPGWVLLTTSIVYWLVLAAFQGRFAAQLAIPLSVFSGMGLVWLVAWAHLARVPKPVRMYEGRDSDDVSSDDRSSGRNTVSDGGTSEPSIVVPRDPKTLISLMWVVLLICSISLFFVPTMLAQTTHSDAQFEAAMAIDEHATETDREYPESFVFSTWGDNRMYNYHVSGESQGYGYASRNFGGFQSDTDPDGWYEEFEQDDVGYVVVTDSGGNFTETSTQVQLHHYLGMGSDETAPLEHYQVIYVDDDATAFAIVPGATITAPGEPGETVTVETDVTVSGETITYTRDVTVAEDGTLTVRVPYSGEYTVGERELEVSTDAVETGSTIELE